MGRGKEAFTLTVDNGVWRGVVIVRNALCVCVCACVGMGVSVGVRAGCGCE